MNGLGNYLWNLITKVKDGWTIGTPLHRYLFHSLQILVVLSYVTLVVSCLTKSELCDSCKTAKHKNSKLAAKPQ